jgi:hypothetical protein
MQVAIESIANCSVSPSPFFSTISEELSENEKMECLEQGIRMLIKKGNYRDALYYADMYGLADYTDALRGLDKII